ncbi:MAG TPA: alpha/beta hydrolase [Rhabdochlamydiaceae bacterium]|jgi:pimeloyl-ACP methyl ester carboxylesterase
MFWKWTKRIGLGLVGTATVLALSGALYQGISDKIDAKKYPPIGKLVDVGGYNIHLHTTGSGGPSVILDAGMGCNALGWSLVQPKVAEFTQVTAIDRAGNGWSDESPLERTSENIVMESRAALKKANILGPYILVGHSFGGINAQLWASLYPDEVLGVVLVDSSHEKQFETMPTPQMNHTMMMLVSRFGIARLVTHLPRYKEGIAVFSEQTQQQLLSQLRTTKFMRTVLGEGAQFEKSCKQLKAVGRSPWNKPLIVISAAKVPPAEGSGYSQEQIDAFYVHFKELQKDLTTKSTQGKQVIAEESDHMITLNQPQIIVDSIKEMVESSDKNVKRICGWESVRHIPSESTFCRAFAEFADIGLAHQAHETLIKKTLSEEVILHNSRDSTPIKAREKVLAKVKAEKQGMSIKMGRPKKGQEHVDP